MLARIRVRLDGKKSPLTPLTRRILQRLQSNPAACRYFVNDQEEEREPCPVSLDLFNDEDEGDDPYLGYDEAFEPQPREDPIERLQRRQFKREDHRWFCSRGINWRTGRLIKGQRCESKRQIREKRTIRASRRNREIALQISEDQVKAS